MVAGAVLQPVLDLLADPDIINYILEISFNDIPAKKFGDSSGINVELLQDFIAANKQVSKSVSIRLSNKSLNVRILFIFQPFLFRHFIWTCRPF